MKSGPRRALIASVLLSISLDPLAAQTSGALDPSYGGGDGMRPFQPTLASKATNVLDAAVAPDGTLWIGGSALVGNFDSFACRVSSTGGGHSCLVVPFDLAPSGVDGLRAVAVALNGGAVLAGKADGPAGDPDTRAIFMRLTSAMTLDSTFGGDGKVDLNLSAPLAATAVAARSNLTFVWAGYIDQSLFGIPNRNMLVGVLLDTGVPSPDFDGDGFRVVSFDAGGDLTDEAHDIVVQSNGDFVVVGKARTGNNDVDYAIARLDFFDGSLDTSFSGDGKVLVSFAGEGEPDSATSVAIDRFRRIVVAGNAGGGVGVVRLLFNGELDPSFGIGGKTTFSILETGDPRGEPDVLMMPGDRILVAGDFDPGGSDLKDNYLVMLEPDGDLDPTFGNGGKVTFATLPELSDPAPSLGGAAVFAGKVLIGGDAGNEQNELGFALRVWMSRMFLDDFETGNTAQWSATN